MNPEAGPQRYPPVDVPNQGLGRQALLAVVSDRQLNLGGVEFSFKCERN